MTAATVVTHDPTDWPRWVFTACAALIAILAAMMVAVATRPAAVAPLAVVAVAPWIFHAAGRHPPAWLFLALTIAPLVALNTAAYAVAGPAAEVAVLIAIYVQGEAVAAYRWREAIAAVVLGAVVIALNLAVDGTVHAPHWIGASAVAIMVGYLMRRQQETLMELRATQAQLVGEAALQERQRIAREVHDVVAHSLTVTMMHVTAARMAVGRDPESAVEMLAEAERLGRQSLNEIRRTVAVLRNGAERSTDRALPTAAEVPDLIDGYRAAGVDVTLRVDADLTILDPQVGLAVYRATQEAVANAAKHAPGAPVTVEVTCEEAALRLRVRNPLPAAVAAAPAGGSHDGMGLDGMRERVSLVGGEVHAATDGREWVVEATVPAPPNPGGRSLWCR